MKYLTQNRWIKLRFVDLLV